MLSLSLSSNHHLVSFNVWRVSIHEAKFEEMRRVGAGGVLIITAKH